MSTRSRILRSGSTLLVRAAVLPLHLQHLRWPAQDQPSDYERWLRDVWALPAFSEATRAASPSLAQAVDQVLRGDNVSSKHLHKAVDATARYFLRAVGRPTPFGLLAGVATADIGPCRGVVGSAHVPLARVDALWLDHVRRDLANRPDVLPHLSFGLNVLAVQHGDVLSVPVSGGRLASMPVHRPLAELLKITTSPVTGREILERLTAFGGTHAQAGRLLADALDAGALTSSLAAPMTEPDPLRHLLDGLLPALDRLEPSTQDVVKALETVHGLLAEHNKAGTPDVALESRRTATALMTRVCDQGRTRLSLDMRLDATVRVPAPVIREAELAGEALLRLTRNLGEQPVWAAYHERFWEFYGEGSLVPLGDAVDLAAGTGMPATFPMSQYTERPPRVMLRDELLMRRTWEAVLRGEPEIELTDADIDEMRTGEIDSMPIVPHMELGIRLQAKTPDAVDQGDFTLMVRPAWSAGTFSGRFAVTLAEHGVGAVYETLPTLVEGALPAQLSFAPPHPHAENIARTPQYLPYVIPVGEHRESGAHVIPLDDLAVLSTSKRMLLVSLSRRRVVEPVVLHPLALEKQAPPVARFIALLARSFAGSWTRFDWGPLASSLPYLPRVRYRRTVLSPARWQLTGGDLAPVRFGPAWHSALLEWVREWKCSRVLELFDGDRYLRLDLTEIVHARLLHSHLVKRGVAELVEAPDDAELGWIGHAHELTLPLSSARPPLPHPDVAEAPVVRNRMLSAPGAVGGRWAQAKLFTHPTVMDQILTRRLPGLLETLGTDCWFVRYRTSQEDNHLRLRFATPDLDSYAAVTRALAAWTEELQDAALVSRLVIDGYRPEFGRYGTGATLEAAEGVFVADSDVVRLLLAGSPAADRRVLCSLGMIDTARGLLGDEEGVRWLASKPGSIEISEPEVTRAVLDEVRVGPLGRRAGWSDRLTEARAHRVAALRAYHHELRDRPTGPVLESLLHMHHNRIMGPDREAEAVCRHAVRQASRSLIARGAFDD